MATNDFDRLTVESAGDEEEEEENDQLINSIGLLSILHNIELISVKSIDIINSR